MDSDSDNSQTVENSNNDESEVASSERSLIRKELSTMSFEDLQKMKEKIGSKQYNKVIFGAQSKKTPVTSFKRANKNRPREMSSKKPARMYNNTNQTTKPMLRDPRFDPLCGEFDDKSFKSNYKFLKDVRKNERSQLEKEYKDETDPKKQQKIKYLMQRMDNQIREQEKHEKINLRKDEERTSIRKKLMKGEKPTFKKKSEKRIENVITKYEELKSNNKLQKHMERRYKKLAKKGGNQPDVNTEFL